MTIADLTQMKKLKTSPGRLMGLDVGSKTIGLALSDLGWMIASPFKTIARKQFTQDMQELKREIDAQGVIGLIVGLPINMDGSEGPRCQSVKQFAVNLLEIIDIPLCFWDERLSTAAVTRTMLDADLSRKRRSEIVDKLAASFILQGALDALRNINDEGERKADL